MYTSSITASGRRYPLRETVLGAWKRLGLQEAPNANSGAPQAVAELVGDRWDGLRQLTSDVYPLKEADVMTETLLNLVILNDNDKSGKIASGVELADGRQLHIKVGSEVPVCSGAASAVCVLLLVFVDSRAHPLIGL